MEFDDKYLNVIFSYKTEWNLIGPGGFKYYWHNLRKNLGVYLADNFMIVMQWLFLLMVSHF